MDYKAAYYAGIAGAFLLYGLDLLTRSYRQKKLDEARTALLKAIQE